MRVTMARVTTMGVAALSTGARDCPEHPPLARGRCHALPVPLSPHPAPISPSPRVLHGHLPPLHPRPASPAGPRPCHAPATPRDVSGGRARPVPAEARPGAQRGRARRLPVPVPGSQGAQVRAGSRASCGAAGDGSGSPRAAGAAGEKLAAVEPGGRRWRRVGAEPAAGESVRVGV